MKCQLCGYEFDEQELICHSQCPLAEGCAIICCPNCGYQVVDTGKSRLAALVQEIRQRLAARQKEGVKQP